MSNHHISEYTLGEEIANSITHGVGALLAIAALSLLVTFAGIKGDPWRVVSMSIFGAMLVIAYLASTLYHAITNPKAKYWMRVLDHSSIFLLIAGTYTPFTLVHMRGTWGWSIFGAIWGFALIGIVLKVFCINRLRVLPILMYVGMGWMIVIAIKPLLLSLPHGGLKWLLIGGICYTSGLVFYGLNRVPYNHAIWHLFVLAGSVCHFFCFLFYG